MVRPSGLRRLAKKFTKILSVSSVSLMISVAPVLVHAGHLGDPVKGHSQLLKTGAGAAAGQSTAAAGAGGAGATGGLAAGAIAAGVAVAAAVAIAVAAVLESDATSATSTTTTSLLNTGFPP